jgi:hypothetical protein
MARQIDPWLGVPQTAVLEENLLAVQMRLKGMEIKLRELDARLGRVAQTANEARSDADRVSGQTLALEAQLADIAGALLMLTDQLAAAGPADSAGSAGPASATRAASVEDASNLVARKVLQLLTDAT